MGQLPQPMFKLNQQQNHDIELVLHTFNTSAKPILCKGLIESLFQVRFSMLSKSATSLPLQDGGGARYNVLRNTRNSLGAK